MKVVTTQYDKNDTSAQKLADQEQVLNKQLDAQKEKLSTFDVSKSFNELETYEDFENAIRSAKTEKTLGALWYKWKDKFDKDSEEYKKLSQTSSDMKTKLGNPDIKVEVR